MRSNSKEMIARGERLIYNGQLDTEAGKKLFWAMQGWQELPRNLKLIELINTIYKAPKDVGTEECVIKEKE